MASSEKKFFDVSKPGKTPATATSRPVIVTNRSIVKDPTLKEEAAEEDAHSPLLKTASKVIAPPKEEVEDSKPEEKKPEEKPTEEKPAEKSEVAEEPEEDVPPVDEPADEVTTVSDDDQVDPGRKDEKQAKEVSAADIERQQRVDKLIATGKYAVPVGHIKRNRRARRLLLVVVLLLLGLATVYLLMDAGIIKTSVSLPLDLIKN